jgi:hypothetical protein
LEVAAGVAASPGTAVRLLLRECAVGVPASLAVREACLM